MKNFEGGGTLNLKNVPTWDEVRKLVSSYKTQAKKKTYWLYLTTLAYTGVRRQEGWNIKVKDYIKQDGTIEALTVYQTKKEVEKDMDRRINVSSKHSRRVPIVDNQLKKETEKHIRHMDFDDYVFDFSLRTCNNIVGRAGEKILGWEISPHDLRHAFAFRILMQTNNLEKARRLLGHSSYDVLKIYLESSQMDLEPELEAAIAGRN